MYVAFCDGPPPGLKTGEDFRGQVCKGVTCFGVTSFGLKKVRIWTTGRHTPSNDS